MSQNINLPDDFLSTLEKTGQYSSPLGTVFAADGTNVGLTDLSSARAGNTLTTNKRTTIISRYLTDKDFIFGSPQKRYRQSRGT